MTEKIMSVSFFFENFEYDDEIAARESFVIEAETCTNYSDEYKLQVDIETPKYLAKFNENNYGYNFFTLFRKENDKKLEWLADFESSKETILTCKIIDQIGDFVYRSHLRLGKDFPFPDTLPCIQNGAHVCSVGLVLKKK